MAASELSIEEIHKYFVEKGGKVSNKDLVKHFKRYLTNHETKDEARHKFKKYINTLASSRTDGDEKYLVLRAKYATDMFPANSQSPVYLPQNTVGLPTPGGDTSYDVVPPLRTPEQRTRQPPPYRPPPPVTSPTPSLTPSLDNISISSSNLSFRENDEPIPPQAPPRRRSVEKSRMSSVESDETPTENNEQQISVKERTQKFNKMASVENDLSPQPQKEKRKQAETGVDEDDGASVTSLEPEARAKRNEWVVAAARGDYQTLAKLAAASPRLAKTRDPFTTALHWAAKHGNTNIIKLVAGTYHADANARTNGGYTPLHIAMQFNHVDVYKLLVDVYGGKIDIRDWSGKKPLQYLDKQNSSIKTENYRNPKSRKKTSDKDLGFLRIGSLNVRVKKTTEAFSNFLGVGNSGSVPLDAGLDRVQKSWGSADNISKENEMHAPKSLPPHKKKLKCYEDSALSHSTPASPNQKRSVTGQAIRQDSDSDIACGFDANWKQ